MAIDWDHCMKRIRTRTNIDEGHEERLRESVSVLRGALGEDWPAAENHPLLWLIRSIHGSPFDGIISMLADNLTALKNVPNVQGMIDRLKTVNEYEGATAELEVGGMLARSNCRLTIEPRRGNRNPDFFCEVGGFCFLAEVKTLRTASETEKASRTSERILAACSPMFPAGAIFKPLSKPHLEEIAHIVAEKAGRVARQAPQEVDIRGVLKLYLVHPDDPDQIERYDKWCGEQDTLGIIPGCNGLYGPLDGVSEHHRARFAIVRPVRKGQLPQNKMGVPFIFVTGLFDWMDVEGFVDGIIEEVYEHDHIPAAVFVSAKEATFSSERSKSVERENYIEIDYYPTPYLRERVLIVKNRFCRFRFDYGILKSMYVGTEK